MSAHQEASEQVRSKIEEAVNMLLGSALIHTMHPKTVANTIHAATDAPNPPSERPTPQEWDECGPINKPMPSERPDDNPEQWTAVPPRPISPAPVPEGREGTPRTDALTAIGSYGYISTVPADFARQLERELTASQSREAELRAAWNAREPQLYAAERTVDELRARVAELEKERDELSIKAISAQAAARGNAKLFEKSKTQLSALQKELAESKEQWRMSSVCRELTAKLTALREAGQELAGAAQEAIKHGEVLGESEFPTPALGLLRSSILRWEDVKWHQSIAAPMGREGAK